jgi:hypothetical protein
LECADQRSNNAAHAFGNQLVDGFHNLALFAIGSTIDDILLKKTGPANCRARFVSITAT